MLISELVVSIRDDFRALGELGGPETSLVADRLGAALEPSIRSHFLGAMNNLVQEFNLSNSAALTLNLEGDHVRIARVPSPESALSAPVTSDYSARIALRLSDDLKENIEHLATDVGSSVNSWIVRTLERSVRSDAGDLPSRNPRQLRGKGRA